MKIKSIIATSLLSLFLAASTTAVFAEDVVANAILGGTPFAITTYGTNVVKGRATLVSDGDAGNSTVIVNLRGLKPDTAHIGHIHGGNCAALARGTIFHNLQPVVVNKYGKGTSKTVIPQGMQGLADCEWWIAFHEGAENPVPPEPQTPAVAVGPVIMGVH